MRIWPWKTPGFPHPWSFPNRTLAGRSRALVTDLADTMIPALWKQQVLCFGGQLGDPWAAGDVGDGWEALMEPPEVGHFESSLD